MNHDAIITGIVAVPPTAGLVLATTDFSGAALLVSAVGTLVTALGIAIVGVMAQRQKRKQEEQQKVLEVVAGEAKTAADKSETAVKKIEELHVTVNSRLTQLLEATARQSKAEGLLQGVSEEQTRVAAIPPAPQAAPPSPVAVTIVDQKKQIEVVIKKPPKE